MAGTQSRDSIADIWGPRTPHDGRSGRSGWTSGRRPMPERWVPSVCVLCSTGCGLDIGVAGGRIVGVRGRAGDRVNHGRLGPKGLHGWEANASRGPATTPLIRRDGRLEPATWDEAMGLIVERSKSAIERFGPGSHRVLQLRPAVPRGVLHARRSSREAGIGTRARRRQHPALHGDRRDRPDRVVRDGRGAGLVRRLRRDRRDLPGRPQHGLDADGPVGARPRPSRRAEPAEARRRRPAPDAGRPKRPTSTSRRGRARTCPC